MYWDRSAREMGLMDTPLGIQAVSRNASERVDDIAAMTIDEVGRLMLQKKSLVSGMLERLDVKPDEHIHDPSMMLANEDDNDTVLPSLRASTASTSTVSLTLPRGDINMQDQEVGTRRQLEQLFIQQQQPFPIQQQQELDPLLIQQALADFKHMTGREYNP